MNKELQIRRRIANIYNKREEHFSSLREYNDYLEEVEDIIWSLVEGRDVAAIEAKVKAYHDENYEQILASKARKAVEIGAALQQERGVSEANGTDQGAGPSGSYAPAVAGGNMFMPQPRQPEPVSHSLFHGDVAEDEETRKLREERAAIAGGWSIEFGHRRALTEAFSSLWVNS